MWWSGRALGFDFESDGPVPTEARAITCAMVRMEPGTRMPPSVLEVMIQPERDIPAEATAVHGITTERAMAEGLLREVAIPSIAATLAEALGPEVPLVGHNVSYDLTLLDREMRRLGVGLLCIEKDIFAQIQQVALVVGGKWLTTFPVIDTMVLDKAVDRYRPGKRKLEVTAQHYGVPMAEGSAHGATADVIASLRIAITIAQRAAVAEGGGIDTIARTYYAERRYPTEVARAFASLGARSLPDLHCAQVRWAAEQADGLREHFREHSEKGVDPADVRGDWPLIPLAENETVETIDTTI